MRGSPARPSRPPSVPPDLSSTAAPPKVEFRRRKAALRLLVSTLFLGVSSRCSSAASSGTGWHTSCPSPRARGPSRSSPSSGCTRSAPGSGGSSCASPARGSGTARRCAATAPASPRFSRPSDRGRARAARRASAPRPRERGPPRHRARARAAPRALRALPRAWLVPKQDYAAARDWVRAQAEPNDAVLTVGLATFPYADYYGGGFTPVDTVEGYEHAAARKQDVWVLSTFEIYVASRHPELYALLAERRGGSPASGAASRAATSSCCARIAERAHDAPPRGMLWCRCLAASPTPRGWPKGSADRGAQDLPRLAAGRTN